jgi:hypothetical protein
MMISESEHKELIGDYEHALRLVNEASTILIDALPAPVEVTGRYGPFTSVALVSAFCELSYNLHRAVGILTDNLSTTEHAKK